MKIVFLSLFLTTTAFGQDLETEHLKPGQQSQAQSEADQTADEAKKRALPGIKTGVTYKQLMADPDNVKLNYRYAAAQVKEGNLLGASAALERVLAVKPKEKKPRILYAVVLFRLGSLAEAEKEFSSLKAMDVTDEMRARIDEYLRRIRRKLKKTQLRVLVGGGIDYDTNRNAGPAAGRRLFLDNPIILNSASTRKGDTGKIFLAQIGVDHNLGFQAGHRVYGKFSYYRAEQTTLSRLNLQSYSGKAGAVVRLPWFDFIPEFKVDHLRLAQTTYLRSRTGRVKFERKLSKKYDVFAEAAHTDLKYNRTQVVPLGHERTGDRI
ncbi:MAG: tetratricopeptide repeat protein, partial [Elusimicrobiota bacterium]